MSAGALPLAASAGALPDEREHLVARLEQLGGEIRWFAVHMGDERLGATATTWQNLQTTVTIPPQRIQSLLPPCLEMARDACLALSASVLAASPAAASHEAVPAGGDSPRRCLRRAVVLRLRNVFFRMLADFSLLLDCCLRDTRSTDSVQKECKTKTLPEIFVAVSLLCSFYSWLEEKFRSIRIGGGPRDDVRPSGSLEKGKGGETEEEWVRVCDGLELPLPSRKLWNPPPSIGNSGCFLASLMGDFDRRVRRLAVSAFGRLVVEGMQAVVWEGSRLRRREKEKEQEGSGEVLTGGLEALRAADLTRTLGPFPLEWYALHSARSFRSPLALLLVALLKPPFFEKNRYVPVAGAVAQGEGRGPRGEKRPRVEGASGGGREKEKGPSVVWRPEMDLQVGGQAEMETETGTGGDRAPMWGRTDDIQLAQAEGAAAGDGDAERNRWGQIKTADIWGCLLFAIDDEHPETRVAALRSVASVLQNLPFGAALRRENETVGVGSLPEGKVSGFYQTNSNIGGRGGRGGGQKRSRWGTQAPPPVSAGGMARETMTEAALAQAPSSTRRMVLESAGPNRGGALLSVDVPQSEPDLILDALHQPLLELLGDEALQVRRAAARLLVLTSRRRPLKDGALKKTVQGLRDRCKRARLVLISLFGGATLAPQQKQEALMFSVTSLSDPSVSPWILKDLRAVARAMQRIGKRHPQETCRAIDRLVGPEDFSSATDDRQRLLHSVLFCNALPKAPTLVSQVPAALILQLPLFRRLYPGLFPPLSVMAHWSPSALAGMKAGSVIEGRQTERERRRLLEGPFPLLPGFCTPKQAVDLISLHPPPSRLISANTLLPALSDSGESEVLQGEEKNRCPEDDFVLQLLASASGSRDRGGGVGAERRLSPPEASNAPKATPDANTKEGSGALAWVWLCVDDRDESIGESGVEERVWKKRRRFERRPTDMGGAWASVGPSGPWGTFDVGGTEKESGSKKGSSDLSGMSSISDVSDGSVAADISTPFPLSRFPSAVSLKTEAKSEAKSQSARSRGRRSSKGKGRASKEVGEEILQQIAVDISEGSESSDAENLVEIVEEEGEPSPSPAERKMRKLIPTLRPYGAILGDLDASMFSLFAHVVDLTGRALPLLRNVLCLEPGTSREAMSARGSCSLNEAVEGMERLLESLESVQTNIRSVHLSMVQQSLHNAVETEEICRTIGLRNFVGSECALVLVSSLRLFCRLRLVMEDRDGTVATKRTASFSHDSAEEKLVSLAEKGGLELSAANRLQEALDDFRSVATLVGRLWTFLGVWGCGGQAVGGQTEGSQMGVKRDDADLSGNEKMLGLMSNASLLCRDCVGGARAALASVLLRAPLCCSYCGRCFLGVDVPTDSGAAWDQGEVSNCVCCKERVGYKSPPGPLYLERLPQARSLLERHFLSIPDRALEVQQNLEWPDCGVRSFVSAPRRTPIGVSAVQQQPWMIAPLGLLSFKLGLAYSGEKAIRVRKWTNSHPFLSVSSDLSGTVSCVAGGIEREGSRIHGREREGDGKSCAWVSLSGSSMHEESMSLLPAALPSGARPSWVQQADAAGESTRLSSLLPHGGGGGVSLLHVLPLRLGLSVSVSISVRVSGWAPSEMSADCFGSLIRSLETLQLELHALVPSVLCRQKRLTGAENKKGDNISVRIRDKGPSGPAAAWEHLAAFAQGWESVPEPKPQLVPPSLRVPAGYEDLPLKSPPPTAHHAQPSSSSSSSSSVLLPAVTLKQSPKAGRSKTHQQSYAELEQGELISSDSEEEEEDSKSNAQNDNEEQTETTRRQASNHEILAHSPSSLRQNSLSLSPPSGDHPNAGGSSEVILRARKGTHAVLTARPGAPSTTEEPKMHVRLSPPPPPRRVTLTQGPRAGLPSPSGGVRLSPAPASRAVSLSSASPSPEPRRPRSPSPAASASGDSGGKGPAEGFEGLRLKRKADAEAEERREGEGRGQGRGESGDATEGDIGRAPGEGGGDGAGKKRRVASNSSDLHVPPHPSAEVPEGGLSASGQGEEESSDGSVEVIGEDNGKRRRAMILRWRGRGRGRGRGTRLHANPSEPASVVDLSDSDNEAAGEKPQQNGPTRLGVPKRKGNQGAPKKKPQRRRREFPLIPFPRGDISEGEEEKGGGGKESGIPEKKKGGEDHKGDEESRKAHRAFGQSRSSTSVEQVSVPLTLMCSFIRPGRGRGSVGDEKERRLSVPSEVLFSGSLGLRASGETSAACEVTCWVSSRTAEADCAERSASSSPMPPPPLDKNTSGSACAAPRPQKEGGDLSSSPHGDDGLCSSVLRPLLASPLKHCRVSEVFSFFVRPAR
uniref:Sister chromatid cohesion protein n=1 Tax=Chromera velia CCMP2878 TaxID=1169474 RepID=A0A0G4G4W5_9ALVE|eukprot:Cvel_20183.t1-p1 / transcript=Cvel_20183.t1 / gene=Cvel_20183 / organism=Chromera_velia_CCMP2878 / gene_product=hypothetical protein / transcript_product=hypothetical protein / location=Cvel_scaffold1794:11456-22843(-) / protein_length=2312 / sequence_SO=supercontig / SO=protein_coding / is_pseudo=false